MAHRPSYVRPDFERQLRVVATPIPLAQRPLVKRVFTHNAQRTGIIVDPNSWKFRFVIHIGNVIINPNTLTAAEKAIVKKRAPLAILEYNLSQRDHLHG